MSLDGPDIPTITGPSVAKIGHSVTLNCSASSYPHSLFKWYFNNSLVANTSEYVTPPLTTDMSGMYTCMANNHITGQNSSDTKTLTVFGEIWMTIFVSEKKFFPVYKRERCLRREPNNYCGFLLCFQSQ